MTNLFETKTLGKRTDFIILAFVLMAVAIIYAPVFYTEYIYTDEAPQLWFSSNGVHATWIQQGRYIAYLFFKIVFGTIDSIHGVKYARLFSLAGWMICLPVWYFILKECITKNRLPFVVLPLSMIYLICMPSFSICIGWASCLEIFLACTSGLISGFLLYRNLKIDGKRIRLPFAVGALACIAGIVSLFTYQNGFGCFFIPFFIQFVAAKKISKNIIAGVGAALLIYILYYLFFKWSLHIVGTSASSRTSLASNPLNKLFFLFTRPMAAAFHFTWLFNERSIAGEIVYAVLFLCWFVLNLFRLKGIAAKEKLIYFAGIFILLGLVYLPSLLVAENYASNRTMLALCMVVFILVAETVFAFIKTYRQKIIVSSTIAVLFLISGWYNFNAQFLTPLAKEYNAIKNVVAKEYTTSIDTIYFIRPAEDAFEKKYHITASWDEFGVPSAAKEWTPESMLKQMLFEKTGNRSMAEKLMVKSWASYQSFIRSGDALTKNILFIDAEKLISVQP